MERRDHVFEGTGQVISGGLPAGGFRDATAVAFMIRRRNRLTRQLPPATPKPRMACVSTGRPAAIRCRRSCSSCAFDSRRAVVCLWGTVHRGVGDAYRVVAGGT